MFQVTVRLAIVPPLQQKRRYKIPHAHVGPIERQQVERNVDRELPRQGIAIRGGDAATAGGNPAASSGAGCRDPPRLAPAEQLHQLEEHDAVSGRQALRLRRRTVVPEPPDDRQIPRVILVCVVVVVVAFVVVAVVAFFVVVVVVVVVERIGTPPPPPPPAPPPPVLLLILPPPAPSP